MVSPPRGLTALLLLHIVLLVALGVAGVLVTASDALLENNLRFQSALRFGYGLLGLLLAGGFVVLLQRNPLRNTRAALGVAAASFATALASCSALPTYVYRLQHTPWYSWLVCVPSLLLAGLALTHAQHLRGQHRSAGQGPPPRGSTERTGGSDSHPGGDRG